MTRKNTWARLAVAVVLCLPLTACKDTKTLQENEQLKAQVAELQKENGQLGNDLETMTADRDALTKENEKLKAEMKLGKQSTPQRKLRVENVAGAKRPHSLKLRTRCGAREPVFVYTFRKGRSGI